jgi:glycosyltransferase involved in cell wall biosynthesis
MLKVAMVNTVRQRGGAARTAANLAVALNSAGVETTLYHTEDNDKTHPFYGIKKAGARTINALLARVSGSTYIADLGFTETLLRLIDDADVLHLHNMHGYYLDYPKLLKAWRNRPIVWTWHDMWGATGRCGAGYECTLWQSGCQRCPHMEFYPAAWIDRAMHEFQRKQDLFFSLRNLTIVSPSEWMMNIAKTRGFNPSQIRVIPNPAGSQYAPLPQEEARRNLGLSSNDFVALFIASDCRDDRKGYRDFASTLEKLPIFGIAIGKPPETPHPRIRHTGEIRDSKTINQYYAAADVMVIPSYADNYPTTVIEALTCGTPVIGYREGGIPSQLDLPYCQLVARGDLTAMRQALASQCSNTRKSDKISKMIAEAAKERWSMNNIIKQYIDTYNQAIST